MQKWLYGLLSIIGLVILFITDITMVVPFSTNHFIASALVMIFYMYLLYLIVFRKIF
ncbi:hypothetical protein [Ornithinibacillus gellani]|uniref:hypothetical protein n=1 Tax=Ornithinibacillus gellani TaxID=2293253 RepID=UPI0016805FD5|nr:hypothetical protein [Ornithinibacillus gellani]